MKKIFHLDKKTSTQSATVCSGKYVDFDVSVYNTGVCIVDLSSIKDRIKSRNVYKRFLRCPQILRRLYENNPLKTQADWCLFALHSSHGSDSIRVLLPCRNIPFQLFLEWFHFLCWIIRFSWYLVFKSLKFN